MRILADENFPLSAIRALRDGGHDVAWVTERTPGAHDSAVMELARREDRTLITFDKDFGRLVFASSYNRAPGILLFRIPMVTPADVAAKILATLSSRTDWSGHFSVIEEDRIRMTPLPK